MGRYAALYGRTMKLKVALLFGGLVVKDPSLIGGCVDELLK